MAFGLWAKNHIGPQADKGGNGLPALTAADIGKALVVGTEPVPFTIIPEQTVTKEQIEGTTYYIPTNTDKSAFVLGAEVTLYWNGENLGTSTVKYNSDLHLNYADFEAADGDLLDVVDDGDGLRIRPDGGTQPDSAVVMLMGAGKKAVWSVGGGVVHISLVNGVATMDRTFAEISAAVKVAPICALWENEESTDVVFVVSVGHRGTMGQVVALRWIGNSFAAITFFTKSDSDYPTASD